jgi:hypothetical protein
MTLEIRNALGPCEEFQGSIRPDGYGSYWDNPYRGQLAHRVAWIQANGPIPVETPFVLHHCDNPPCIRISHLFLGTRVDNNRDRDLKGRGGRKDGEYNGHATLTWGDVLDIRQRNSSTQELVDEFSISAKQIRLIKRHKAWRS